MDSIRDRTDHRSPGGYFGLTRSATYAFLASLPLFVAYESLILFVNDGSAAQVRVGADVWIKEVLQAIGGSGIVAILILLGAAGTLVFLRERKEKIPLHPEYFAGMVAESLLYAVLVAVIVSSIVGFFTSIFVLPAVDSEIGSFLAYIGIGPVAGPGGTSGNGIGTAQMLVLSIGAGLYEELIFRVVLVGGLFLLLRQVMDRPTAAYMVAAVAGAFVFSAVHYVGPLGDTFQLASFSFRFLFGLALNGIFLVRGFGIAAWTHALYDILVVSHLLG